MASQGVTVRLVCKGGCGRKFSKPRQSSRLYCTTCRPEKLKPTGAPEGDPLAAALNAPGEVERSLRAELERAGRIDRYQGVLAIRLAKQLDSGTSVAGAQGLVSQIDAMMTKALDGVLPPADFVDDIGSRRKAKAQGAG